MNKTIAVEKNDVVDKKVDNVVEQVPISEHKDEINNKDSSSFSTIMMMILLNRKSLFLTMDLVKI